MVFGEGCFGWNRNLGGSIFYIKVFFFLVRLVENLLVYKFFFLFMNVWDYKVGKVI